MLANNFSSSQQLYAKYVFSDVHLKSFGMNLLILINSSQNYLFAFCETGHMQDAGDDHECSR